MGVAVCTVRSGGRDVPLDEALRAVDVRKEVNRVPAAVLLLADGSVATGKFALSDSKVFDPGSEVEILMRYEAGKDARVFKGRVVRHGLENGPEGLTLSVELKDDAVKMTLGRKTVVHRAQTDADVIKRSLKAAGMRIASLPSTPVTHRELVQFHCTDWDFMLSRADALGLLVSVDDGEVSFAPMEVNGPPEHTFTWGIDPVYDFEFLADAGRLLGEVRASSWNPKKQQEANAEGRAGGDKGQGALDPARVASTVGFGPFLLRHPAPLEPAELRAWADARLARSRLAFLRGRLSVAGDATIKPLQAVKLARFGDHFNGVALVTGVRHRVSANGWHTDLQLGLSPEWFAREPNIADAPAAGLLPPVHGLQVALVDRQEADPDKLFRVRVLLQALGSDSPVAVWARLAAPYAGSDHGTVFRPERGDEVVVGFFNDDPRQAVILGALHSSMNGPPAALKGEPERNDVKGFVSRNGTGLLIDDAKKTLTVSMPSGATVRLDDEGKTIEVKDAHGNTIRMESGGITIKSAKDLTLEAAGGVTIKGSKVDVK